TESPTGASTSTRFPSGWMKVILGIRSTTPVGIRHPTIPLPAGRTNGLRDQVLQRKIFLYSDKYRYVLNLYLTSVSAPRASSRPRLRGPHPLPSFPSRG